jgi:hypothetical protein
VGVIASPEALPVAERAAAALRADGHELVVVAVDEAAQLGRIHGIVALGGPQAAAAARSAAPVGVYLRVQALPATDPDAWEALALAAVRATAVAVAPPGIGMCG